MNTQNSALPRVENSVSPRPSLSKQDIEKYICNKLKELFDEYPEEIAPSTTFGELERYHDSYLTDPGLLIDIEEDLGVYLPDEEALALNDKDVRALVDAVVRATQAVQCVSHGSHIA